MNCMKKISALSLSYEEADICLLLHVKHASNSYINADGTPISILALSLHNIIKSNVFVKQQHRIRMMAITKLIKSWGIKCVLPGQDVTLCTCKPSENENFQSDLSESTLLGSLYISLLGASWI